MCRTSNNDLQTTNPFLARNHFVSGFLFVLLILFLDSTATLAQSDPFKESKPATANPFAGVATSDEGTQVPSQSAALEATTSSGNPFDEIPDEDDQQDSEATADLQGTPNATALPPMNLPEVKRVQPPETEETSETPVKPATSDQTPTKIPPSPPANNSANSNSTDWLGWLIDNWYLSLAAIILLPLLCFPFLKSKVGKKDPGRPRIKTTGSFKKSDRFKKQETSETKKVASESKASDSNSEALDVAEQSDILDLGETASSSESDDETDGDFLELVLGDSEEDDADGVV
jgi:hypothetical protein